MVRVEPGREEKTPLLLRHEGHGEFEKLGKPKRPRVFTGDLVRWFPKQTLKWEFEKDGGFVVRSVGPKGRCHSR